MSILKKIFSLIICFSLLFSIYGCGKKNTMHNKNFEWKEISYSSINNLLKNEEEYYLLFKNNNCIHCPEFEKILKPIAESNKINVFSIETSKLSEDEKRDAEKTYKLKYVPALHRIKNNESDDSIVGLLTKDEIQKFIDRK